ncbi:20 kDa chaperonin, chloroplastic-like [Papaver somniferum]|uniref:20 kDa chaperonin, chloroplastic-like n=1 Tax=Papaver somniferum TaxID=3469 RepID=UPI000E704A54|nr:20 kDa chaperonin, chloroplastic-like [Papaver somniferum]
MALACAGKYKVTLGKSSLVNGKIGTQDSGSNLRGTDYSDFLFPVNDGLNAAQVNENQKGADLSSTTNNVPVPPNPELTNARTMRGQPIKRKTTDFVSAPPSERQYCTGVQEGLFTSSGHGLKGSGSHTSSQFERNSNPSFLYQKLKGNDAAVTVLAVGRHKPLGDRVLVVTKTAEQKTTGGIQSPSTAQTKPQGSEILSIEKGKTVGKAQVDVSLKTGAQIIYSKYAGTEVDLNGVSHLLLNDDVIVGILETEDVKDFKPLSERVLINVEEAEKETAGGLLLTEDSKEKPSIGTFVHHE